MAFGRNGIDLLGIGSNENILVNVGIYNLSSRHEANDFEINAFKTKNNLTLTKDISGAYYNVITPGTGTESISLSSKITAKYTVRYLNGAVLESSPEGGFSSTLNELYKGWQLILPNTVKAGGKIRLVLPSHLGSADGNCLDFDIEITNVTN
jgi:FKBP-type peptidyl-prolyl cis-trans isomerase